MKRREIPLCILVLICMSAVARAQVSVYQVKLQDTAPTEMTVGEKTVLRVNSTNVPANFHVRVFFGTVADQKRRAVMGKGIPGVKVDKDCVLFETWLIFGLRDSAIHLDALSDPSILNRDKDGRYLPTQIVLVFEGGEAPTTRIIAMRGVTSNLDTYFSHALSMTLNPPSDAQEPEKRYVSSAGGVGSFTIRPKCYEAHEATSGPLMPGPDRNITQVAVIEPVNCSIGLGAQTTTNPALQLSTESDCPDNLLPLGTLEALYRPPRLAGQGE